MGVVGTREGVGRVLHLVRSRGPLSTAALCVATGMSRTAVTQRLSELVLTGVVGTDDHREITGGRSAITYGFRPEAASVLSIELAYTSVAVGLADLSGRVLHSREQQVPLDMSPGDRLDTAEAILDDLISRHPELRPWWGLGVGVFCAVDVLTGEPAPHLNPLEWAGFPLSSRLRERYGVPVFVDNEVNMMALGELGHGAALGHTDILQVKLGTGVGAGVVMDGELVRGVQGMAGEIGHIKTVGPRTPCPCGGIGCLGAEAGGLAVARQAALAAASSARLAEALSQRQVLTAQDVAEAAADGDEVSIDILRAAGHHLARTLDGLVSILDPSLVIVGGGLTKAGEPLLAPIREAIARTAATLQVRTPADGAQNMALAGASRVIADRILQQIADEPGP